jgi:serine/threonine-protein phosphatase Stp1
LPFDCVSRTHVGLRRKVNEDALVVRTDRGLWAVADGMGGHDAGDVASRLVTEALSQLPVTYKLEEMVSAATRALERVNRELIVMAGSRGSERGMGSTIVGLAHRGSEFRCFWAGDSRAYRLRDGRIERLSRDHSLVQDLVDAGMIGAADADKHPNANVITRAVGASEELRVDTVAGEVRAGDCFLLASDGLTRLVDDEELGEVLRSMPAEAAAERLIELTLARGAPDNVTLIILTAA